MPVLPSVGCMSCEGHKTYNAMNSATSEYEGGPITLNYGQGSVEGYEYSDDVFLGSYEVV